ncbi:MAG: hypothetical protein M0C28_26595 [Candidatus Moduliflexus flocculans]|nr:hypothetical protein [Candidatus Moduliflexus flocculans]
MQAFVTVLRSIRGDVRWVRPDGLHLTLKFLGEIDEAGARPRGRGPGRSGRTARRVPPRLPGHGGFSRREGPARPLGRRSPPVPGWPSSRTSSTGASRPKGFEREQREFKPHLTLGRVKGPGRIREVVAELDKRRGETFGEMTARARSRSSRAASRPDGPEYRIVREAELA